MRKYRNIAALCRRCQVATVGLVDSDDERFSGRVSFVDPYHLCPPCGELDAADRRVAAIAEEDAAADAVLAKVSKSLGVPVEQLRETLSARRG